ncbi:hypothetical protein H5410_044077 [Solanum commersonii]|uniref:Uncharacterized protein n=1 Tax=Solanum commersonii TaxID=4109 RepID=A0A9J5XYY6_SOLCO|nr:hypothetical protein H5410_044077 [Solanum commersonii]
MEPIDPHCQNDSFSRSKKPWDKYTPHFANFDLTYELVNPHGQNDAFSRSNESQSSYGASWPSQPQGTIFKTSVKNLAMDPFVPHGQNGPFSKPNEPQSRISTSFLSKFYMDVLKTLAMDPVGPYGQNSPFSRSNETQTSPWIFGDPEFRPHFHRNLTWTSVKTLALESVGLHGQNGPFSKSNDPQSRIPTSFLPKVSWTSVKTLAKEPIGSHGQNGLFSRNFTWMSVKTLAMEPVRPHGLNNPFSRSNDPRSRPYLWSQLALMDKTSRIKSQTSSRAGKPPFCQFSCAIVHGYFGDSKFRSHFCQNYSCTSVKTLAMEPVGSHGHTDPFSRSKNPRSSRKFSWTSIKTLAMEPVVPHHQHDPFSRSKNPWSSYGASLPSRPKLPIFKIKQASEQIFDLIFAKNFHGGPLRP